MKKATMMLTKVCETLVIDPFRSSIAVDTSGNAASCF